MKKLLVAFTIFLMINCHSEKRNTDFELRKSIIISEYTLFDSLLYSNEFRLEKTVSGNKVEYIYREVGIPDSMINYSVTYFSLSDSIMYQGERFAITGMKEFSLNNKSYKILKYFIDSDIADNDEYIFIAKDYGLLTIRSIDWGNYLTFNDEQKNASLILNALKGDKTGFFR